MSPPSRLSRLTRRTLLQSAAASSAGLLIARVAGAAANAPPAEGYIDMHTHVGQTWNSRPALSAEALLRWMDAHHIAQAVVLPLASPESSSFLLTPDFVLAETRKHRDRLIPFCSVDPRTSYQGGHKGLVEILQRYQDAGARGFGEHKPGVAFNDPRNLRIFAACEEVKLPVLFHLDNERNTDTPGLPGLEKALQSAPGCTFIGHGPGWWASISGDVTQAELGGYPRGPVSPGGAIDRLMEKYPNLYGECSAGSGANSIARDLEFGRKFLERRQDRVMFGTDFLAPEQNVPQFDLFEKKLDLPAEIAAKIFRNNARRVLGLS